MNIPASYSTWAKLRDWSLGPTIRFPRQDAERFLELDAALGNALGPFTPSDDDPRRLYATSPWHAAFMLAHVQHLSIVERTTHLLFRGQKRSSWPLVPKLDRLSDDQEETNRSILEVLLFGDLMTKVGTTMLTVNPEPGASFELVLTRDAHTAVAQHYDLNTPLLDFTADPAVAVYFASRDEKDLQDEYASVYVYQLPFKEDTEHLLNLRLPPPFIERPYLQKGVYMESVIPGDIGQQVPWDMEVRFPVRAENQSFAVIREDVLPVLPDSDEISAVVAYARAGVSDFIFENEGTGKSWTAELMAEFSAQYAKRHERLMRSLFREKVKNPLTYVWRYVECVEDMLYWLCYCPDESRFGINLQSLKLVTKSNPEIIRMLISSYRWLIGRQAFVKATEGERSAKRNLIDIFENALKENGLDPRAGPNLSSWLGIKT